MRLKIDGKTREKQYSRAIQRVIELVDALPYGEALTTKGLATKLGIGRESNPYSPKKCTPDEIKAIEQRRRRVQYHLWIWANPNTIRDIDNGTINV